MKRMLVLVLLAAVATATAFALSRASARSASVLTITLYGKNREGVTLDTGTAGTSLGDVRVSNRELFNKHGARVGRSTVDCVYVETGDDPGESVLANCEAVIKLPGGEIVTEGVTAYKNPTDLTKTPHDFQAVVGGTGIYQGVWGTEEFSLVSPTVTRNVLRLHRM
jgi:hypothetical protein